ncbi:MAG TPA: riboflavin synthase [Longimicrobiaceae bacterium]|nr:riboflavin synthase [Longimicrobiaceae bacterium]
MFTGIIEEVGTVAAVRDLQNGVEFRIRARTVLEGIALGDSIAMDGVCLTATAFDEDGYTVQAVATTLGRTTLGELAVGRRVNLERAAALGARLGGHLVQGHVDGVGEVVSVVPRGELVLIDFTLPPEVDEVTILHGSITLNGISLTVNALPAPGVAQVSIVPFTWAHTNLADLAPGARVNLEGDLIGKYVRRLLERGRVGDGGPGSAGEDLPGSPGY